PRFAAALKRWQDSPYASEIAALYRAYRERLDAAGLVDSELFASNALERLRHEPQHWGRTPVFVYGFDDFTELELEALEILSQRTYSTPTGSRGRPIAASRWRTPRSDEGCSR